MSKDDKDAKKEQKDRFNAMMDKHIVKRGQEAKAKIREAVKKEADKRKGDK